MGSAVGLWEPSSTLTRVAAKLKHEDLPLKKIQMPNKFFLGSVSLAPIKPRHQKAATEQGLGGHPSQSR